MEFPQHIQKEEATYYRLKEIFTAISDYDKELQDIAFAQDERLGEAIFGINHDGKLTTWLIHFENALNHVESCVRVDKYHYWKEHLGRPSEPPLYVSARRSPESEQQR